MERTSIKINLEGGSCFELQSPSKEVSNDLYTFSKEGFSCTIPGMVLECHIPPFGKTHMLVETPGTAVDLREVIVYGIKCEQEAKMSPEQVANRVLDVFGVNVQENITALNSSGSISVEDGESAYPCGTLFTSGTYSRSSSWSSSPSLSLTPPRQHTPSPRPVHLSLGNANSKLITPHTVATPNTTFPNHALVAGTGSYKIPYDEASEDSAPAPASNCARKVIETVQTHLHTLAPVQKVQHQDAGETMNTGVIVLETPGSNDVRLAIRDVDANSPRPIPFQSSSQESEARLPSQPEQAGPTSLADTKPYGNQLVVGIRQPGKMVSSLKPSPSFGRQRSLPGEKMEKAPLSVLPRNASDACLSDLIDEPFARHAHASGDLGLNLHVLAYEQTDAEPPKDTPTTPTKPMGIQRQESVANSEQNEFVMPKPRNIVLYDPLQKDVHHSPVMAEQNVLVMDQIKESVDEEVSTHSHTSCGACEGGDPILGGDTQVTSDACDPGDAHGGSVFKVLEAVASLTDSSSHHSSDHPEHLSAKMKQVHLLEHAMNGYCLMKDACKVAVHVDLEFTQAVEQMRAMVDEARNGGQDEDLQDYIRVHCRECRDKDCKVPHVMAGCLPPGETFSSSESDQTDSPQRYSPCQESPISFDQEVANQSTSSDVQRHLAQDYPVAPSRPLTPHTFAQPTSNTDMDAADFGSVQPSQNQTAPFSPKLPQRNFPCSSLRKVPVAPSYLDSPAMLKHFPSEQLRSGGISPMGSTGFLLPGVNPPVNPPVGVQHQQESQLGAETYFHQVSDKGQTDLRPREKGQYQYLEPSRSGNGLRKMYGVNENQMRVVKAGEFPSYQTLPRRPGALIYAAQGSDLIPGESYPCPQTVPNRDKLGKGGNGTVVKFPLGGTEYALKLTQYRESELNTWSQLDHPNVVPLLGVMMGEQSHYCYQFMPRMTGDLRSMMIDHGDLLTHLQKHPKEWDVVSSNTDYILENVLSGLCYLHSQNIQHSDLKANNILIMKKCTCPDILHCECPRADKYDVKIADFDSLKKTTFARKPAQFSEIWRDPMNEMDMNGVKGTPAYRAPEQFKRCPNRPEFKRTLDDGKGSFDMEGPWCDMWSLGVIVLQMVLGSHNKGPYISEASILTSCKADKMVARVEAPVATLRLARLQRHSLVHSELKLLTLIAGECLEVDCRERSTAEAVLKTLKAQLHHI